MSDDSKKATDVEQETEKQEEQLKEPEIIGGGANNFAAKMMRQLAETAPVISTELDLSELPVVELPNLQDIVIQVPALPPITEEVVMERFELVYYDSCVERKMREPGEAIELGDEVLLDIVGYAGGKILPFSAQENLRIRLEADSIQPGVGTMLVGTPAGETKVVSWEVPQDGGEAVKVAFIVDVKNAASLTFPKADDPETLKPLGLGNTLDEVYGAIAAALGEERAGATLAQGMALTLSTLADMVNTDIEKELVDAEIRSQWTNTEGRFLMEKGLSRQDLDDALEGWMTDKDTRETAKERLNIAAVMMMYSIQDPTEFSEDEVEGFFRDYAQQNDINYDEWRESLEGKEEDQAALLNEYIYLRTMTHITSEVTIQYQE